MTQIQVNQTGIETIIQRDPNGRAYYLQMATSLPEINVVVLFDPVWTPLEHAAFHLFYDFNFSLRAKIFSKLLGVWETLWSNG